MKDLMTDEIAKALCQVVNGIARLVEKGAVRTFFEYLFYLQRNAPEFYCSHGKRLYAAWNYASHLMDKKILPVTQLYADDIIARFTMSPKERFEKLDVWKETERDRPIVFLAPQTLVRSNARVPSMKCDADPETGICDELRIDRMIVPAIDKPILVIEFCDGERHVVAGRHLAEWHERKGQLIPARILYEAEGWSYQDVDGAYDYSKLRILDALDNMMNNGRCTIRDYECFFRSDCDSRSEKEFLDSDFYGCRAAKLAYAMVKEGGPDLLRSIDSSVIDGESITEEQAGVIAALAPISGGRENRRIQWELIEVARSDYKVDENTLREKYGQIKREGSKSAHKYSGDTLNEENTNGVGPTKTTGSDQAITDDSRAIPKEKNEVESDIPDNDAEDNFDYDDEDDGYILYVLEKLYAKLKGTGKEEDANFVAKVIVFANAFLSNSLSRHCCDSYEFSISLRSNGESRFVSFAVSESEMEIYSGGSVDLGNGHDSYGDIVWRISKGRHSDYDYKDVVSEINELLACGARLVFE